jgi:hypothetical protein
MRNVVVCHLSVGASVGRQLNSNRVQCLEDDSPMNLAELSTTGRPVAIRALPDLCLGIVSGRLGH